MVKDLICGMDVNEKYAIKREYKGKLYCFCSTTCQREFVKNPEQFIK